MLRSGIADWLIHCADPQGPRGRPPRRLPSPTAAVDLVRQARSHGVLAGVRRHFPPFAGDPNFAAARAAADQAHRENLAFAIMLRQAADELTTAAADLPVAVVKGPVFARLLYPDPALRSFSDIDVLAAPEAVSALGEILRAQGFALAECTPSTNPREWKWVHREQDLLMVEVQTDLIHAASLRGALALPYAAIAGRAETPAALLLTALVHGGAHHYDRLQHVVDVCQAARLLAGSDEARAFAALVAATGTRFVAVAGLTLAGRLFDEPRCRALARALGPTRYAGRARLLLGRGSVTSTATGWRPLHSWRRQAFRALIKRAARD